VRLVRRDRPVALTKLEGVSEAKVSYSDKRATVGYEPAKVTPAQLVGAVKGLGYEATLLTP
jgi:copper chaperone CopZ